jgi:hypothetical protein
METLSRYAEQALFCRKFAPHPRAFFIGEFLHFGRPHRDLR